MSKRHDCISDEMAEWISRQRMYFVATAPLSEQGHINASPKGGESFRVLSPLEVVYHDLTGSGAETIAHLRENGRILIMFCAFDGAPKIVRLHGQGRVITTDDPKFTEFQALFPPDPGTRSFIHVKVDRVSDSCGFGVPLYDFKGQRDNLQKWAVKQGADKLVEYRATKNQKSIDNLPAWPVS